jgi:hypothetical protein
MLRKLRRLASLSPGEWLLLPQLAAFSLLTSAALGCVPLPRLASVLSLRAENRLLRCFPLLHRRYDRIRLYALVDMAARVTSGQGRCLVRSLLLFWLVKARGEPVELLIGVSKDATLFQAHAWVETQGRVIGDRPEMTARFATIHRL